MKIEDARVRVPHFLVPLEPYRSPVCVCVCVCVCVYVCVPQIVGGVEAYRPGVLLDIF